MLGMQCGGEASASQVFDRGRPAVVSCPTFSQWCCVLTMNCVHTLPFCEKEGTFSRRLVKLGWIAATCLFVCVGQADVMPHMTRQKSVHDHAGEKGKKRVR